MGPSRKEAVTFLLASTYKNTRKALEACRILGNVLELLSVELDGREGADFCSGLVAEQRAPLPFSHRWR